jgi:acyl carrier protein
VKNEAVNVVKNEAVNVVKVDGDGDEVERALLRFVAEEIAADRDGLRTEENLIDSGRVDSLGLLHILSFIDAHWHVDLMIAGTPRDLLSVATMAAAVRRQRRGDGRAESA